MGTNCPLLVDLFLYSYEAEFIQKLIKDQTNKNTMLKPLISLSDILSINKTKQKQLPLPHFLTFALNLTPMVNFLPDYMIKETTSIFPL